MLKLSRGWKKKLVQLESRNANLETENSQLKEKLLELEFQQKRNNLLFEGIFDSPEEPELTTMSKLRHILKDIP